ncbi:PREDICTED: splicing factor 3A subunit 3-like [Priapulus caudatus]|uniref:Splicing factor 3A subunit 3-like n=1 Tax=Priapulus caudatus TaxID=37621 RepID=A0ABM1F3N9_PRICU|nr:PREDICTED: splicing factor 3A subunit 3-like [Priapulus caudatus]
METLLEQQRRYHEERERLTDAMVKETLVKKATGRETINSDHRQKTLLDRYMDDTTALLELYEDKDGLRKEEVAALSGPNEFAEFYTRLKSIRDFHKLHPNEISVPMSVEFDELAQARDNPATDDTVMAEFTDEEGYGKYLDLHECFERFVNLKGITRVDYQSYLSSFDQLFDIPKDRKNYEYRKYIEMPGLPSRYGQGREWAAGRFARWRDGEAGRFPDGRTETSGALAHTGAHLDLSAFSSAEELASLGLDRLKSALMALGLTVCWRNISWRRRANRLFSTKGKKLENSTLSLAKSKPGKVGKNARDVEKQREVALLEAQLYRLVEVSELYKLHGLNISYTCEICGNHTYKGPKARLLRAEKCFACEYKEWRHAHGMRCLGIPNTAHFANVTKIEDAIGLWEKIKVSKATERWRPDQDEEYEDSQGNVVTKKTYDDLKRQGLL